MGSGIALVAVRAGLPVTLVDPSTEALDRSRDYLQEHLAKKGDPQALETIVFASRTQDLGPCEVVVEAAPEDLSLKQATFAELDRRFPAPTILATNTSTLSVTAIASATRNPERVAGLHFFNPVALMPLVEVAQGAQTNQATMDALLALVERLGKTPVRTADTPGFIVNRIARPFYGEALRILGEGTATHDQIDRIVESGGGFRMGPFRLMDLIGLDVNFAATKSMWEQTFGEPRYRPHPIQARMVEQGALGRKAGRGFYSYGGPQDPAPDGAANPPPVVGPVMVSGGTWAPGLVGRLRSAGFPLQEKPTRESLAAFVVAGTEEGAGGQVQALDRELDPEVPILVQTCDQTLSQAVGRVEGKERVLGFDGLFAGEGRSWSLVAPAGVPDVVRRRVEGVLAGMNTTAEWIGDGAGLVLPRLLAMLANESAFAVAEGTADEETINRAMQLGANYPIGPLAWMRKIGADKTLRVLEHLRTEFAEERYRIAPRLRRWARGGQGRGTAIA